MLVLSRRTNEKIHFPTLQVTVQVVAVKPGVVRLGIDAPPEVPVFREEILDRVESLPAGKLGSRLRHALRNRLSAVSVGVALLRRQLEAGQAGDVQSTLDRIDDEVRAFEQEVQASTPPVAPSTPARCRQALLVEDDHNERELLAGFLRVAGMEVTAVPDGEDALDYLHNQPRPDVVLLDMVLPRCDGPTTLRTIRHNPRLAGLKVFAMSGHSPQRFGLDRAPQADRWFSKPLNPEALLRDLNQELGCGA